MASELHFLPATVIAALKAAQLRPALEAFLYLQVLDLLTTMVGIRSGLQEASPFIRHVMQISPAVGLGISKLIAVGLAALCVWLQRGHLIRWINYWYAALVVWNLCLLLVARQA